MRAGRSVVAVLFTVVALVAGCSSSDSETDSGKAGVVQGDWQGTIEVPGEPLPIGVSFAADGTATIDIPDQGVSDKPLKDVRAEPDRVEFAIPDIPGDAVFRGKFEADRITGEFSQSGQTFPLTMQRGTVAPRVRPQEPKPPFPYESEDVTYQSGDITIAGTLTRPEGAGPFPAVVLISGSGPQDRDEELFGHKPFLLVADTLTRAGYAVLRTDDRGVGGTGGKLDDMTYPMLADDVAAGLGFLRARSDIDPARVGLFGHSEGGYLAPLVAARPDSGVAFAILMAGPSVIGGDIVIEQGWVIAKAEGTPEAEINEQMRVTTDLVKLVRAGDNEGAKDLLRRYNESLPPDKRTPEGQLEGQITPYFTELINYDPAPALSALRIPVYAFFGGKDLQVLASQNEQPMRTNLAANPDATVQVFPGLNHLMQPTDTGKPSEYGTIETTTSPEVLSAVTAWLTQRVPTR